MIGQSIQNWSAEIMKQNTLFKTLKDLLCISGNSLLKDTIKTNIKE